jgi:hypothetical protein
MSRVEWDRSGSFAAGTFILSGFLDFSTNSDSDESLEQAGPEGSSQVIVLRMFQRID